MSEKKPYLALDKGLFALWLGPGKRGSWAVGTFEEIPQTASMVFDSLSFWDAFGGSMQGRTTWPYLTDKVRDALHAEGVESYSYDVLLSMSLARVSR